MPRPTPARLLLALGLGSNEAPRGLPGHAPAGDGDPRSEALESGLAELEARGFEVLGASRPFETVPVGVPGRQPAFLNACAITAFEAGVRGDGLDARLLAALAASQQAERAVGRRSKGDGAPRPLDVDLLAGWSVHDSRWEPLSPVIVGDLVLPHPRLADRAFVLVPLSELLPDALVARPSGEEPRTVAGMLQELVLRGIAPGSVLPARPSRSFPMALATGTP